MKMTMKRYNVEFEVKVALEVTRGDQGLAEMVTKRDVHYIGATVDDPGIIGPVKRSAHGTAAHRSQGKHVLRG